MAYIVTHHRPDGSVERKRVTVEGGMTSQEASEAVYANHNAKMKTLRDKHGWSKGRKHRLICSIPNAVVDEVFINDGPEAAKDMNHLIRRSEELGFVVRTRRSRR